MFKYLVLVIMLIFGALAMMYFFVGASAVYEENIAAIPHPHVYQNPDRSFSDIRIAAFYFVPKNKTAEDLPDWRDRIDTNLKKLQEFHALQFQGRSRMVYDIYPDPVLGLSENLSYDTDDTRRGNPRALLHIGRELQERVFDSGGDLYRSDFFSKKDGEYPVFFILYNGVGASGGVIAESSLASTADIARSLGLPESVVFKVDVTAADGFFILSQAYFTDPQYRSVTGSLVAHEFYHTIGVPDGYEEITARPTTSDIMGLGRFKPLEKTSLQRETLKALGL